MESISVITGNLTNSVVDMAANASERASLLLPLAKHVIVDTVLTNYTQAMCNELSTSTHSNGTLHVVQPFS